MLKYSVNLPSRKVMAGNATAPSTNSAIHFLLITSSGSKSVQLPT